MTFIASPRLYHLELGAYVECRKRTKRNFGNQCFVSHRIVSQFPDQTAAVMGGGRGHFVVNVSRQLPGGCCGSIRCLLKIPVQNRPLPHPQNIETEPLFWGHFT